MGHARTYTAFDILHRILTDYFGKRVQLVMGMTDVDDKIIARATEQGVDFDQLARKFEGDFIEDMEALGVRPPSTYLRVSEHIPEIIEYIKGIERQGCAYRVASSEQEHDGGVYFDVAQFTAQGHQYGKLKSGLVEDMRVPATRKRSAADFALWKAAKSGEPSWEAPFGRGRPGWHIECSAMCSSLFGSHLDIHTGGVDLAFPHHCNEIAQCEAHNGHEWTSHFLHSGHLHIEGLKMSKSLKNFITIKQLLEDWPADTFRMLCLSHRYNANFDFVTGTLSEASSLVKRFQDFFEKVNQNQKLTDGSINKWGSTAKELSRCLLATEKSVDECLRDDFNTPGALHHLQELVRATLPSVGRVECRDLVKSSSIYIARMLSVFGLRFHEEGASSTDGVNVEQVLTVLTDFRWTVRSAALQSVKEKTPVDASRLLKVCDEVRDTVLPAVGVELKDTPEGSWARPLSAPEIAQLKHEASKPEATVQARRVAPRLRVEPRDYFKHESELYSRFDADGVPTHDVAGVELSKSLRKKLTKKLQVYAKKFDSTEST
jgi:cysteinyl-tRNA synthetase